MYHNLRRTLLAQAVGLQLLAPTFRERRLDRDARDDIEELASGQIAPWTRRNLGRARVRDGFRALDEKYPWIFVIEITGGRVGIVPKPAGPIPPSESGRMRAMARSFAARIEVYKVFFEHVLARAAIREDMTMAIDVNDLGVQETDIPLLSFQKRAGGTNILLPDFDFFWWNWYRGIRDSRAYEDKAIVASFAGASTGSIIDTSTIAEGLNPRLRSAAYFLGSELVDFRIARAAQIANPQAKTLLEGQPYFSRHRGWRSQLRNRLLISMDGNGAACSRLVIGLKSRSAVIKYDSPFVLYYFPRLVPGRDYIPVSSDAEVETVVAAERATPGTYRAVADSGRRFFERYLERDRVIAYTAALLRHYAAWWGSLR
jgi:hypothetical protein